MLWLTGLSGAGKSTIANLVDKRLSVLGRHTTLLDGDNLRHGLNRDLGFTKEARVENIRRVAEVAALFVDAGMIALVSLISPFRSEREMARSLFAAGEFIEIHVATPLAECERRDPKGLYRKARAGELAELHRHRPAVRDAGGAGDLDRHLGAVSRGGLRAHRELPAGAPLPVAGFAPRWSGGGDSAQRGAHQPRRWPPSYLRT